VLVDVSVSDRKLCSLSLAFEKLEIIILCVLPVYLVRTMYLVRYHTSKEKYRHINISL
jgi:hypothetical protein